MQWCSEVSIAPSFVDALAEAATGVRRKLGVVAPDIVFAFASPHHREHFDVLAETIADACGAPVVFGCSGGGVIGGEREVERKPALSLVAAILPGVQLRAVHCSPEELGDRDGARDDWHARLGMGPDDVEALITMLDPFSCEPAPLLRQLDLALPTSAIVGGVASGGQNAGEVALFADGLCHRSGMIALAMGGNLRVDTLLAQGCRPIGEPMFVTRAEAGMAYELDGRVSAKVLQELYERSSPPDRQRMRSALFLGVVMEAGHERYRTGDFLVRNIVGLDARTGGLAVTSALLRGMVVQFHVRDAETSANDLARQLTAARGEGVRPNGALMFSCLGRGQGLYGRPDFDLEAIRDTFGELPIGGFFGNGEIGPLGHHRGRTFMHGYTTALAMFSRRHVD